MREDYIHYAIREHLKSQGWLLIAGEYPNGSDDELHSLRIMDRYLAKDSSPDHRRHSLNKIVPDLVAFKDNEVLVIEMKPTFSTTDEKKLEDLFSLRMSEFKHYLDEFINRYFPNSINLSKCIFYPALGFSSTSYISKDSFIYLLVESLEAVKMVRG